MGRHSARAEDEAEIADEATADEAAADEAAGVGSAPTGRHARADPGGAVDRAVPEAVSAPTIPGSAGGERPRGGGSAADLAILRSDSSLLARCLAATLAPFLIYVIVLVVLGAPGHDWLIWIWLPAVVAGVTAGAFLDRAHRGRGSADAAPRPGDGRLR